MSQNLEIGFLVLEIDFASKLTCSADNAKKNSELRKKKHTNEVEERSARSSFT
jgi:hypothetical protein